MPIPHIGSWWASLASDGVKQGLTALTIFVMIFGSVGCYAPIRTVRMWCLFLNFGTLCGIFLTGNFNFFAFLAIVLLISFLDDQWVDDFIPGIVQRILGINFASAPPMKTHRRCSGGLKLFTVLSYVVYLGATVFFFNKLFTHEQDATGAFTFKPNFDLRWLQSQLLTQQNYSHLLLYIFGCTVVNSLGFTYRKMTHLAKSLTLLSIASILYYVLFVTAIPQFVGTVGIEDPRSLKLYRFHEEKIRSWSQMTKNYHFSSGYGLFRVMTGVGSRPEFVIQYQSPNTNNWTDYEFRDKVGPLDKMPRVSMPHQARVEWQLWFTALDPSRDSVWLHSLSYKLMRGDEKALAYVGLEKKPGNVPSQIKFAMYKYWFNSADAYKQTGNYWRREVDKSFNPRIFGKKDLENIRNGLTRHAGKGSDPELALNEWTPYFSQVKIYDYLMPTLGAWVLLSFARHALFK